MACAGGIEAFGLSWIYKDKYMEGEADAEKDEDASAASEQPATPAVPASPVADEPKSGSRWDDEPPKAAPSKLRRKTKAT